LRCRTHPSIRCTCGHNHYRPRSPAPSCEWSDDYRRHNRRTRSVLDARGSVTRYHRGAADPGGGLTWQTDGTLNVSAPIIVGDGAGPTAAIQNNGAFILTSDTAGIGVNPSG